MFCPRCRAEYDEQLTECPDCHVALAECLAETERPGETDLDVLIRTGHSDPVAIGLMKCLLQEAGIPFFAMDQNAAARQESGNLLGWWSIRVPQEREAEAREILQSLEETGSQ